MASDEYVNRARIAWLLDVDERTITNWVKQRDDFPSRVAGKARTFPVRACIAWYRDYKSSAAAPTDIDEAKARREAAEAQIAELKLAKQRGELLDANEVRRTWERILMSVRTRILGMRSRHAPAVVGLGTLGEAVRALDAIALDILASLREAADELESEEAADEPMEVSP